MLNKPGFIYLIHNAICLPNRGQEQQFILALSALTSILEDVQASYSGVPVFVHGDANTNPNNPNTITLLHYLLLRHNLDHLNLHHPTYHHFTASVSMIANCTSLLFIKIISQDSVQVGGPSCYFSSQYYCFSIPLTIILVSTPSQCVKAPKVRWEDGYMGAYYEILSSTLPNVLLILSPSSATGIIINKTNMVLWLDVAIVFMTTQLSYPKPCSKPFIDRDVRPYQKISHLFHNMMTASCDPVTLQQLRLERNKAANELTRSMRRSNFTQ